MADQYNSLTRPFHNLSASTDPTTSSDSTQGYSQGSFWYNLTSSRTWLCIDPTAGAAKWIFDGANYNSGGSEPNNVVTQFGGSPLGSIFGVFFEEGNLYRNCGNPIKGNLANTSDNILDGFVMPAGAFDVANRQLMINFNGSFGANNNSKRVKVWINPNMSGQTIANGVITGGTVTGVGSGALIFDTGVVTTNNGGWQIDVVLCKYGATGSNTQYTIGQGMTGAIHLGSSLPVYTTINEANAMNILVTGASPTTGAANDVVLGYTEINAMN